MMSTDSAAQIKFIKNKRKAIRNPNWMQSTDLEYRNQSLRTLRAKKKVTQANRGWTSYLHNSHPLACSIFFSDMNQSHSFYRAAFDKCCHHTDDSQGRKLLIIACAAQDMSGVDLLVDDKNPCFGAFHKMTGDIRLADPRSSCRHPIKDRYKGVFCAKHSRSLKAAKIAADKIESVAPETDLTNFQHVCEFVAHYSDMFEDQAFFDLANYVVNAPESFPLRSDFFIIKVATILNIPAFLAEMFMPCTMQSVRRQQQVLVKSCAAVILASIFAERMHNQTDPVDVINTVFASPVIWLQFLDRPIIPMFRLPRFIPHFPRHKVHRDDFQRTSELMNIAPFPSLAAGRPEVLVHSQPVAAVITDTDSESKESTAPPHVPSYATVVTKRASHPRACKAAGKPSTTSPAKYPEDESSTESDNSGSPAEQSKPAADTKAPAKLLPINIALQSEPCAPPKQAAGSTCRVHVGPPGTSGAPSDRSSRVQRGIDIDEAAELSPDDPDVRDLEFSFPPTPALQVQGQREFVKGALAKRDKSKLKLRKSKRQGATPAKSRRQTEAVKAPAQHAPVRGSSPSSPFFTKKTLRAESPVQGQLPSSDEDDSDIDFVSDVEKKFKEGAAYRRLCSQ